MARKPAPPATPRIPLPHNWMADGRWKITAMLNKIAPADYLSEARRFEQDAIADGRSSDDWATAWRDHCRRRLVAQIRAHPDEPEIRLFG